MLKYRKSISSRPTTPAFDASPEREELPRSSFESFRTGAMSFKHRKPIGTRPTTPVFGVAAEKEEPPRSSFEPSSARANHGYQPKKSDIIIAVIGPTGTGKSTFINQVAGRNATTVGDDLSSCTQEINVVDCDINGRRIVLVDTPGFNDTNLSDMDVLRLLANWLKQTFEEGIELCGLLYFHRITDNRMAGSPLRLLETFKNICGTDACKNVILTTSMWEDMDEEEGVRREDELRNKYWSTMLTYGARTARLYNTPSSAFELVSRVDGATRLPVLLQKELVILKKDLSQTAAGKSMFWWLTDMLVVLKKSVEELRKRLKRRDLRGRRELKKKLSEQEKRTQTVGHLITTYNPERARSQDTLVSQGSARTVIHDPSNFDSWSIVEESSNPPNSPCDDPPLATGGSTFLQGTITSLKIIRELVGLAPVPGVKNVVTLALNIVEGVETMGAVDGSLLVLARNTSSLATSVVEITQNKVDSSLQARINDFIKDLTEIDETMKMISKRSIAGRFLLSNADRQTVEDCNRNLILATGTLGMHAAIHNSVSNARLEEKMDEVLSLLRSHLHILPGACPA